MFEDATSVWHPGLWRPHPSDNNACLQGCGGQELWSVCTTLLHRATSAAREEGLRGYGSDGIGHARRYMQCGGGYVHPSMGANILYLIG